MCKFLAVFSFYMVACLLKARIVKPTQTAVTCRPQRTRNNKITVESGVFYATTEERFGEVFSVESAPWIYNEGHHQELTINMFAV
jgi:hypothetical protein